MKILSQTLKVALSLSLLFAGSACGDDDDGGVTVDARINAADSAVGSVDSAVSIDASSNADATSGGADAAIGGVDAAPNQDPVASFTINPPCTDSNTDPITFTSTSTDVDSTGLTCSWSFSNGSPSSATGCTVSGVTFPHAAPYNCTLTVSDGEGGSDQASMSIGPCTK